MKLRITEASRKAIELKMSGLTYRQIAPMLGLSFQRVQQMIRPPKPIWAAVKDKAKGKCQSCGVAVDKGHVHHNKYKNIGVEDFNDFPNLSYLCPSCHSIEHSPVLIKKPISKTPGICPGCKKLVKHRIFCSERCSSRVRQRRYMAKLKALVKSITGGK